VGIGRSLSLFSHADWAKGLPPKVWPPVRWTTGKGMRWTVRQGNVLDERADVLVCSANIYLNLSGGVGGEITLRYGPAMQEELHRYLSERGLRRLDPGNVVAVSSCGTHFKSVLHAIAVDAFYDSSEHLVRCTVLKALTLASELGTRKVALTALGTGYGHVSIADFGRCLRPLLSVELPPIEEVVVCVLRGHEAAELQAVLLQQE